MLKRRPLVPGMFPGGDVVVAISQLLVKVLQQANWRSSNTQSMSPTTVSEPQHTYRLVNEEIHGAVLHHRDEVPR
jgi:hypothetical protein